MTAERKRAARCQGSNGAAGRQAVARHTERLQLLRGQALALGGVFISVSTGRVLADQLWGTFWYVG